MPVAARSSSFCDERRDQRLAGFGADDACGVGIEGDGDGADASCARLRYDLGDDPLVAAMDAVEVADGGDGWAEVSGDVGELTEYLHQAISKVSLRPS